MEHGLAGVAVQRLDGEPAGARLVERCRAFERALACDGYVGLCANHHGLLLDRLVEGYHLVLLGGYEPVVLVANERLAVYHLNRLWLRLGLERHVVRLLLALEGANAEGVGRASRKPVDNALLRIDICTGHFFPSLSVLQLYDEAVLALGIVGPSYGDAGHVGGGCLNEHRLAEVEGAVFGGQAVDVVLYVCVAVGCDGHGVVLLRVGAVGLFPCVGHSVVVGVGRLLEALQRPRRRDSVGQLLLGGEYSALGAERLNLVHHVEVYPVAVGQRGSHRGQELLYKLAGLPCFKLGVGKRLLLERRAAGVFVTRNLVGVEHAVAVAVLPVVNGVDVEVGVAAGDGVAAARRAVDEEVVGNVDVRLALRVATHEVASVLPVVHDVVHILLYSLHLVVAGGVVAVEVAVERYVVCLHEAACRMLEQALAHDCVGDGYVLRGSPFAVGVDGERLVKAPREGAVVEDHVRSVGDAGAVFAAVALLAHAEAHVAHDDVAGPREGDSVAVDGDSLARGGLPGNGEVVLEHQSAGDVDNSRNVEDDDSVGLADGVAERACAAVVEVGHVVDFTSAPACGEAAPALRPGERQLLRADTYAAACKQQGQQQ